MARTYKTKDVQTKPSLSGEKNMTDEIITKSKEDGTGELMCDLIPLFDQGVIKRKRTTNWTPDELTMTIRDYFIYCAEKELKPTKSGIRVWIGISRSQYHAWQSEPQKYGEISDIIGFANDIMENQYINRGEKYPTLNIFLLKASHEYIETSKLDLTSNTNVQSEDIKDLISKMGLDKTK